MMMSLRHGRSVSQGGARSAGRLALFVAAVALVGCSYSDTERAMRNARAAVENAERNEAAQYAAAGFSAAEAELDRAEALAARGDEPGAILAAEAARVQARQASNLATETRTAAEEAEAEAASE